MTPKTTTGIDLDAALSKSGDGSKGTASAASSPAPATQAAGQDLRSQAELIADSKKFHSLVDIETLSPEELRHVLHELRVHQIELEMQNEELRRAQAELDASRARYFDLYDLAPVGYCTVNEKGSILEANLTAATMLDVPRSALVGQQINRFILTEDHSIYYRYRKQLFRKHTHDVTIYEAAEEVQVCELRMLRDGSAPFWVQLEGTAVQRQSVGSTLRHQPEETEASQRSSELNAGDQQACRIVIIDISERKLAEQASKHAEEALRQAQKLEGIGTLASGIAHDFNNLLNAILGQTILAITKLPSDSPAVSNLAKATKATERATDLTRQLLAYTGKGKFVTENIDLNRLVEENAEFLKVSVPKSTQLRYEISPAPTFVRGDISQLQQVIMNLIINAGEAIGTIPGQITIRTSHIVLDKDDSRYSKYTNHPLKQINYALLQVIDSGSGMRPEVLDRIFDPFFTTKFIGRGLGLAAALGIVRGHHGGIYIESEEGKGTRFDIVLPLVRRHLPVATQTQPAQIEVVGEGTTLLVIDDESFMIDLLTDILAEAKFTVMTASNPIEGIELYRQHWKSIAAVILDYSMPGMDGAAAFEQLAAINSDVQVLLCSGYPMGEVASAFGTTRPYSFVQKPYQPATLLDHVRKMISAGKK